MIDIQNKMMRRALALARRGLGRTSPNPAVGCVIVRNGEIVGEGWHRKAGTPHAEVHALSQAGDRARAADVYVTLEPCSHHGRTPPCAEALIKAGVARVFAGMTDPNPLVSGRGLAMLREAGIFVECGVLEEECRILNEAFLKHVTTGLPFVILKSAMTLDGKTATASGDSKWITCEESRRYVHTLRSRVDAIMVGVGTVLADDPQLTCRMVRGKDPHRIVVDSRLRTPPTAALFHLDSQAKTILATIERDPEKTAVMQGLAAETLLCEEEEGRVDLADLLRRLGARGVQSILLEGGRELVGSAVRKGLVDKYLLFYAPKIIAGGDGYGLCSGPGVERMADAFRLKADSVRRFAEDFLVIGYPER
ncbi:MAG: bifunctional diaminohydroxyphosphoribosylaminopyrimidine deaminase/5-amino-6-(5-phosphoribosylamino)uracil reductase RibD [Deltaproteobacteria bacterium]|nr:bifunctional diaminohydroxyphosphoribosylaminopyrimidine deaminase/5-amino-6-(5-phosphoribosylamino)uracil reductase RibD [Deltaproteobacteria bacterium]